MHHASKCQANSRHDFNNQLQVLLFQATLLKKKLDQGGSVSRCDVDALCEDIIRAAENYEEVAQSQSFESFEPYQEYPAY